MRKKIEIVNSDRNVNEIIILFQESILSCLNWLEQLAAEVSRNMEEINNNLLNDFDEKNYKSSKKNIENFMDFLIEKIFSQKELYLSLVSFSSSSSFFLPTSSFPSSSSSSLFSSFSNNNTILPYSPSVDHFNFVSINRPNSFIDDEFSFSLPDPDNTSVFYDQSLFLYEMKDE
jgi:hypothetical protein